MATNPILEQLEAAKRELAVIDRQIADLNTRRAAAEARVEAFTLSAKYLQDMQAPSKNAAKSDRPRLRMPSDDWKKIFGAICERYRNGFGYDDVVNVAGSMDIDIKKPSLRTKMMNLANNGYVERMDEGRFRVTPAGIGYFGLDPSKTNEASGHNILEAPQVTERVDPLSFENQIDAEIRRLLG